MKSNPRIFTLALAIATALLVLSLPTARAADQAATWTGLGDGVSYSDPANWSTDPAFPNNNGITYDAVVGAGLGDITLDVTNLSIDSLTLGAGSTLTDGNSSFAFGLGADSTNDGSIEIYTLRIDSDLIMSGTGTVVEVRILSANASTLTIDADQTFTGVTIDSNFGNNSVVLINDGILQGNGAPFAGGGITIQGRPMVPVAFTHHGLIRAINNSSVFITLADVVSDGDFVIEPGSTFMMGPGTLSLLDGTQIDGGGQFFVNGTALDLTGTITSNADLAFSGATTTINGNVTIGGAGNLKIETVTNSQFTAATPGDTLTIGAEQIVGGNGIGTFDVDVILSGAVELTGTTSNRIEFAGITTVNGPVTAAGGSSVKFSGPITATAPISADGNSYLEFQNAGANVPGVGGTGAIRFTGGVMTVIGDISGVRDVSVIKAFGVDSPDVTIPQPVTQLRNLTVASGSIDFPAGLAQLASLDVDTGTIRTTGTTTVTGNIIFRRAATLAGSNPATDVVTAQGTNQFLSDYTFDGITFDQEAGGRWLSSGTALRSMTLSNGAIFNHNAADPDVFELDTRNGSIVGTGQFNNAGHLVQPGVSNQLSVEVPLHNAATGVIDISGRFTTTGMLTNDGAINLNTGGSATRLNIVGSSTISGPINVANGSTLQFGGGATDSNHVIDRDSTIGGAGAVEIGSPSASGHTIVEFNGTFDPLESTSELKVLGNSVLNLKFFEDATGVIPDFQLPEFVEILGGTITLAIEPGLSPLAESEILRAGQTGRERVANLFGVALNASDYNFEGGSGASFLAGFILVLDTVWNVQYLEKTIGGEAQERLKFSTFAAIIASASGSNTDICAEELEASGAVALNAGTIVSTATTIIHDDTTVALSNGSTATLNNTQIGSSVTFRGDGSSIINLDGLTTFPGPASQLDLDAIEVNVRGRMDVAPNQFIYLGDGVVLQLTPGASCNVGAGGGFNGDGFISMEGTPGNPSSLNFLDQSGSNTAASITVEGEADLSGVSAEISAEEREIFFSKVVIASPAHIIVDPNLTIGTDAEIHLSIGGRISGTEYDLIEVEENLTLGGALFLGFLNGFENDVTSSDTFEIFAAGLSLTGDFANVAPGERLFTDDGFGSFVVNYGAASPFHPNSVVLSQFVIPEPATGALIFFASAGFLLRRNRSVLTGYPDKLDR